MNDRYRLGGLEDDQLLAALSRLVRRENDSLSDLLAHLAELDERGLCIALGYPSLFAYCTEALRFCNQRRVGVSRPLGCAASILKPSVVSRTASCGSRCCARYGRT